MRFLKTILLAVASIGPFFVATNVSESNLESLLQEQLGANFSNKSIREIYLAGPQKTQNCSHHS